MKTLTLADHELSPGEYSDFANRIQARGGFVRAVVAGWRLHANSDGAATRLMSN